MGWRVGRAEGALGGACVRGYKAEVGEEGFFLGGCWSWWWRCWERVGRGLEKAWWCLDWGSRAFDAGEALGSVGGVVVVDD